MVVSASAGAAGHQHLARHGLGALVAVELLQQVLDEVGGGDVLDLVDHEPALAADAAAADVEHLHGGLELVLGEADDVGVGAVAEHDGVLLQRPLEGAQVVAQPGRALVVELAGRGLHLALDAPGVGRGLAGEEGAEVLDDAPVLLGVDPADARRGALADVAEQAGAPDLAVPLEDPGAAGARREDAQQQVDRLADRPGVGVRAEVAHALALGARASR